MTHSSIKCPDCNGEGGHQWTGEHDHESETCKSCKGSGLSPTTWNDLRPEIQAFALEMEKALRRNDDKGGWASCTPQYLYGHLLQEMAELTASMIGNGFVRMLISNQMMSLASYIIHDSRNELKLRVDTPPDRVQYGCSVPSLEAVDVANFAMMIADNAKRKEHKS